MAIKKGIPEGMHSLTPHLVCRGAAQAIEFCKKAFGAVEIARSSVPGDTRIIHAAIRIGDSVMMLNDEFPEFGAKSPQALGGSPVTIHLYVEDCDATVQSAVAAGAKVTMPPMDAFWGDRYAKLEDPFGHHWSIATKVRDVPPDELAKAAAAAMSAMKGGPK